MNTLRSIVFVCSVYRPHVGGVETLIEEIGARCLREGIQPIVVCKRFPSSLPDEEELNGIKIIRYERPQKKSEYERCFSSLEEKLSAYAPQLVHVVGVRRPSPLIGRFLAQYWNVPLLFQFVGGDLPELQDAFAITAWKEDGALMREALVAPEASYSSFTRFTGDYAAQFLSLDPKIVSVLPVGIEYEMFNRKNLKQRDRSISTVRRLVASKGIDTLIEAFALFKKNPAFPDVTLEIIGDGPERENLQNLVEQRSLTSSITFHGYQNLESVAALLGRTMVHVCPSRTEGGGLINVEAMAGGALAIGSRVGGIPEFISDQKTGFTFDAEDISTLANLFVRIFSDPHHCETIRTQATLAAAEYDWSNIFSGYLSYWQSMQRSFRSTGRVVPRTMIHRWIEQYGL
jgi:glycosyltransferase involved in cell wall biosynthesis